MGHDHQQAEDTMKRLQLRHVLCPMDLSAPSMNALSWANAMARTRSAELRALHVDVAEAVVTEGLGIRERDALMDKMREALLTTDAANHRVGAAVRHGDPGTEILRYARTLPADLIVMGAAGAERPARPVGSVTATVVPRSDCPVLIVPAGRQVAQPSGALFGAIVCAVDLIPSSITVIRQAISIGWETRGHIMCVCVMTEQEPSVPEITDQLHAAIPSEALEWCTVEVVVTRGAPATEIVKIAESSHADLLVIGPPRQWTSTTEAVLARSMCPVLVAHDVRPLPYPGTAHAPIAS
jgi:nucleotide-binding universal stress UspA family protein